MSTPATSTPGVKSSNNPNTPQLPPEGSKDPGKEPPADSKDAVKGVDSGTTQSNVPRSQENISLSRELDLGPALHRTYSVTNTAQMVKFYKDRIFARQSKKVQKKMQKGTKQKRATVEVPRYLIQARSPGCRLRVMLAQIEAPKKFKKQKGRSPGAPTHVWLHKVKKPTKMEPLKEKPALNTDNAPKPQVIPL